MAQLGKHLRHVERRGTGMLLAMRGRRQVGKSRLVEEFVRQQSVPHCTERVLALWPQYHGYAVEPVVRACIESLLPSESFGDAHFVGSYWTRQSDVEVDLVGGRAVDSPTEVSFVGSIKWRDSNRFGRADFDALLRQRSAVPGGEQARLVGVCPAGFDDVALDVRLSPADLVQASART